MQVSDVRDKTMKTYDAAYDQAIWVDLNEKGFLQLTDRDRLALIHRMSTNDLLNLRVGQGTETVLTTPVGRIIDMLMIFNDGDRAVVITGRNQGARIHDYLRRHIFFNDKVQITDLSP